MNQRGSFSQNILKSIFFWIGPFLALIIQFKITNHVSYWLWIDLTEENGKKSILESFVFEVLVQTFFFLFFFFLCFNLSVCFSFFVIIFFYMSI